MTRAYYNEIDKANVAWLKELIKENFIAPGDVDDRDIRDVKPIELRGYTQHHFFAGIGGWSLALRRAGVADHAPLWTGSCPCQPFSAAGRRGGFADERHLWPSFYHLIAQCRPSTIFGEQVASAADWLRLVRGDLEALEYAVGAMPIEAASAGADHLRDRFWFVADSEEQRRPDRDGRPLQGAAEFERPAEQPERCGSLNVSVGNAGGEGLAFRSIAEVEPGDVRHEGSPSTAASPGSLSLADADQLERRLGNQQPARQQPEQQSDTSSRDCSDLSDTERQRVRGERPQAPLGEAGGMQGADGQRERLWADAGAVCDAGSHEWVIGADQKIRRVKSGVRLLVDGIPNRVGLLRGFGNAIDPRPAAAFIKACLDRNSP